MFCGSLDLLCLWAMDSRALELKEKIVLTNLGWPPRAIFHRPSQRWFNSPQMGI